MSFKSIPYSKGDVIIFDMYKVPPSEEERAGAKQDAEEYLRLWRKRAIYATAAFLLSCAAVSLFLEGHPLHIYWEAFGKYLVLVSMVLLIPFVICVGVAINSWFFLRALNKGKL
jgi:hypothetical protein